MPLPPDSPGARYRFSHFELSPAKRELLDHGRPLAIGGRAFDVLVALIERRSRLVGKNELLDLVWADVVVEERICTCR
jgi:DNA-binding winged helix-turn-helix (wHTH) protein